MIGQKFGRWTVLEQAESRNKKKYWKCQCECGTIRDVCGTDLRNGKSKSCGCLKNEVASKRRKDLKGQVFGRLTVLEEVGRTTQQRVIWKCLCSCGNVCEASSSQLMSGKTQSCGCLQKERTSEAKKLNLIGERFGKLIVIAPAKNKEDSKETQWLCKCDCGNEKVVTTHNLRSGHTTSCGCLTKSKGEIKVAELLKAHGLSYQEQFSFNDLLLGEESVKRKARFDFFVEGRYIIEFDGVQHFKVGAGAFDCPEKFEKTQKYDAIKNAYCKEHNIPLIRVPYTKLETLCIEDLLLETSQFIIK